MYFDIYALIADHCPEHERSVATGDPMKNKSLKKIFNYKQKICKKQMMPDLSHPSAPPL